MSMIDAYLSGFYALLPVMGSLMRHSGLSLVLALGLLVALGLWLWGIVRGSVK